MPGHTSLPDAEASPPFRVETDLAAVHQHVASWRGMRSLWIGIGFAVVMLMGISAIALHPSAAPSDSPAELAFGFAPLIFRGQDARERMASRDFGYYDGPMARRDQRSQVRMQNGGSFAYGTGNGGASSVGLNGREQRQRGYGPNYQGYDQMRPGKILLNPQAAGAYGPRMNNYGGYGRNGMMNGPYAPGMNIGHLEGARYIGRNSNSRRDMGPYAPNYINGNGGRQNNNYNGRMSRNGMNGGYGMNGMDMPRGYDERMGRNGNMEGTRNRPSRGMGGMSGDQVDYRRHEPKDANERAARRWDGGGSMGPMGPGQGRAMGPGFNQNYGYNAYGPNDNGNYRRGNMNSRNNMNSGAHSGAHNGIASDGYRRQEGGFNGRGGGGYQNDYPRRQGNGYANDYYPQRQGQRYDQGGMNMPRGQGGMNMPRGQGMGMYQGMYQGSRNVPGDYMPPLRESQRRDGSSMYQREGMYMPQERDYVPGQREGMRNAKVTQEELRRQKDELEQKLRETQEQLGMPNSLVAMNKTQVNVQVVLQDWIASMQGPQSEQDQMKITNVLQDIEASQGLRDDHHVLGLAFGKASEENIQAVASVALQSEWYGNGNLKNLLKEQGLREPRGSQVAVAFIDTLVSSPKNLDSYAVEGALVQRIIDWAWKQGMLVEVSPPNDEVAEFYASLGFEPLDVAGSMQMVYRGSHDEAALGEGRLLDFDLDFEFAIQTSAQVSSPEHGDAKVPDYQKEPPTGGKNKEKKEKAPPSEPLPDLAESYYPPST